MLNLLKTNIMKTRSAFFTLLIASLFCFGCTSQAQKTTSQNQNKNHMNTTNQKNPYYSKTDTTALNVSDEDWKKVLPEDVYYIARNKGTERAFTGKYWDFEGNGTYSCACCGNALFKSDAKFGSSCGWPSFYESIRPNSVIYKEDNSYGMSRVEVLCGRCNGHLGHIFDDGPAPTYKRFCMNSLVLDFEPDTK